MQVRSWCIPKQGQLSYMVEAGGEAAVIDPDRDITPYLASLREVGTRLRWILLTHGHEDFVAGHAELAAATGAPILVPRGFGAGFPAREIAADPPLPLGDASFLAVPTPGHAPAAMSLVFRDADGSSALFPGDALLIGDVGRVDHLGPDGIGERARTSFESLVRLCECVDPGARVHPGHTLGTLVCRQPGPPGPVPFGECAAMIRGLARRSEEDFLRWLLDRQPEIPRYWARAREMNRLGPPLLATGTGLPMLDVEAFAARAAAGSPVLDARLTPEYNAGHVPSAIHVGPDGQFELWAGAVLPDGERPVCVVAKDADLDAVWRRLARIGFEAGAAALQGGMDAWRAAARPVATAGEMDVEAAWAALRADARWQLVDVRRLPEWETFHAPGAQFIPMQELERRAGELDPSRPLALVCRSGYRSSIASSLLEARGFRELYNVAGGMLAWKAAGLPTETG